ncbi:MAG: hypothetical protein HZB26_17580 [Candidatus Hydrogenedentes bacterium]|nr:hypothetical protein [Candidatus Hydrogenedentota bacterium]
MTSDEKGTLCWLLYSFADGQLKRPPDPAKVDFMLLWDGDDCAQGALLGRDENSGHLFHIGRKSWRELKNATPPTESSESVAAIPLTKDKEGLAFWVKTSGGEYVLARIRRVEPATFSDLVAGKSATIDLEWTRSQIQPVGN